ncbi:MAG TPA: hypothetical protein VEK34_14970 [Methylocella sp.]|nr:hypothetical protein [Methylocella sp.]
MFRSSKSATVSMSLLVAVSAQVALPCHAADEYSLIPTVTEAIPISPVTAGSSWPAVNRKTGRVYIANNGQNSPDPNTPGGAGSSVTVIDGATDRVIDTIAIPYVLPLVPNPPGPSQIAIDEERNILYVATIHGAIAVVDGTTNRVTDFFVVESNDNSSDGLDLRSIVRSKKTGKLYASASEIEIVVDDPKTHTVLKRIPNPAAGPLSIDQTLNRIYTSGNAGSGSFNGVMVIDGNTDEVKTIIPTFGSNLEGSAVDEQLHHLYIAGELGGGFVTIDTWTNTVINGDKVWAQQFSGFGVDVDPVSHGVYSTEYSGALSVIDGWTGALVASNIQVAPVCDTAQCSYFVDSVNFDALAQNLAVNKTTGKIYVADFGFAAYLPYGGPSVVTVLQIPCLLGGNAAQQAKPSDRRDCP